MLYNGWETGLEITLKPEDYLKLAAQNPNQHYDIMDGDVVEVVQKPVHGWIQGRLLRLLKEFIRHHPVGYVHTSALYVLDGEMFLPDLSISFEQPGDSGYLALPPVLAVEIRFDTQSRAAQRRKARRYIKHRARMVWVVMPREQVEIYRPYHDPMVLSPEDVLLGFDVLPDFFADLSALLSKES